VRLLFEKTMKAIDNLDDESRKGMFASDARSYLRKIRLRVADI